MSATAAPLVICPACNTEMRLFGIEPESPIRDLYSFACDACGRLDVRGVLIRPRAAPPPH